MVCLDFTAFFALASVLSVAVALPVPNGRRAVTHTGRGTWYDAGLGACGFTDSNSDPVIALSVGDYGSGENCNRWITVTNVATGAQATGQVRDKCSGCPGDSIDMSPALFSQLGSLAQGVLQVSWVFDD
ncbi:hypothetical protein EUX98_g6314 [Antrodiella citrinella]|uniref:RlpA-like protein double-psi beta-barrel domain-containing protein n=1 Tax=Antrodiella citrinella TaxID=2447956 RepID=A0A4S4MRZ5_9APHY|nr:hypothetical protein EUX98_g6314 [Antrodiella citrinella]